MIYALVFLAMLFLPGNTWLFMTVLIFAYPHIKLKQDLPQRFFLIWMGCAIAACIFSANKKMAFFGCDLRMEGLMTWMIIARLAWLYWETEEDFDFLALSLGFALLIFVAWSCLLGRPVLEKASMAGLSAVGICILWAWMPSAALLYLPVVILSDSRAAVIGAIAGIALHTVLKYRETLIRKWKPILIISMSVLTVVAFSPVGSHFRSFDFSRMGSGFRTHWILQAWEKSGIMGRGLDTQSLYLTQPKDKKFENAGGGKILLVADRVHNVIFDTILTTGWLGYAALLGAFGAALGFAINYPSHRNLIAISGVTAWCVVGLMNPQGIASHILAITCLAGMQRNVEVDT